MSHTNEYNLKNIRCPQCFSTEAFVVQVTMNVVMHDDGIDFMGCSQPDDTHFHDRIIPANSGFADDDPIECFDHRGGCGYTATMAAFRVPVDTMIGL